MKKALFWLGVIMSVVLPLPMSILYESSSYEITCFVSGILAVLFSKFETIEELSVGPLKTKLRVAISEATATIEQVRTLASELSNISLTLLMATEFMGGMDLRQKFELHRKVVACLSDLGASAEKIQEAQYNWVKGVSVMYFRLIRMHVEGRSEFSCINPTISKEEGAASRKILAECNVEEWLVASPNSIRSILKEHSINKPEVDAWVDDYENFLNTCKIPRFELFLSSQRHR